MCVKWNHLIAQMMYMPAKWAWTNGWDLAKLVGISTIHVIQIAESGLMEPTGAMLPSRTSRKAMSWPTTMVWPTTLWSTFQAADAWALTAEKTLRDSWTCQKRRKSNTKATSLRTWKLWRLNRQIENEMI